LDGLIQAVLYVDGVYLLIDAVVAFPVAYLDYSLQTVAGPKEIDLFVSELEKCLADKSVVYGLIRGDLQFFVYDNKWQSWAQQLLIQRKYITAIPFLVIFARMIRKKYKSNFIISVIAAGIGFVFANEAYGWAEFKVRQALADKTNCGTTYVQTLLAKHASELIAKQLESKLQKFFSEEFSKAANIPKANVVFWLEGKGKEYVFAIKSANDKADVRELSAAGSQYIQSLYCSRNPYWDAMRGIGYSLTGLVFHQDQTIVSLKVKPDNCSTAGLSAPSP
jgi:hypothetical protein